jgi:hypothetical protein
MIGKAVTEFRADRQLTRLRLTATDMRQIEHSDVLMEPLSESLFCLVKFLSRLCVVLLGKKLEIVGGKGKLGRERHT